MSEIVVLFEDNAHESLLRQVMRRVYGCRPPRVRYERCTDCSGVERRLSSEVDLLHARRHQQSRRLLVTIDADQHGISGRVSRLDEIVARANAGERDERIAYVIPCLEAENWYVHFCCPSRRPIDEACDYKRDPDWRKLANDLGAAARNLARAWQQDPTSDPPSVRRTRREFARLFS